MSRRVRLSVLGMTCTSCSDTVSRSLSALAGVESVEVDLASQEAIIDLSSEASFTAAQLQQEVEARGFGSHVKSEVCSQVCNTFEANIT
jgi:P-type Cu+ transporter